MGNVSVSSQEATPTVYQSRVEDFTKILMRTKNVFKIRTTSTNNYENNNSPKATGILGSKTKEILRSCLRLLTTEDLDRNRVGLQRLAIAVTKEGQQRDAPISRALVYGGPSGSDEELLQFAFTALICDAPYDDTCDMDYHDQDEDPTTPDDCR